MCIDEFDFISEDVAFWIDCCFARISWALTQFAKSMFFIIKNFKLVKCFFFSWFNARKIEKGGKLKHMKVSENPGIEKYWTIPPY